MYFITKLNGLLEELRGFFFFASQFVVPALFLQWESLFQDKEEGQSHLHNAAIAAINKWSHSNSFGRIIVLRLNEKQQCKP